MKAPYHRQVSTLHSRSVSKVVFTKLSPVTPCAFRHRFRTWSARGSLCCCSPCTGRVLWPSVAFLAPPSFWLPYVLDVAAGGVRTRAGLGTRTSRWPVSGVACWPVRWSHGWHDVGGSPARVSPSGLRPSAWLRLAFFCRRPCAISCAFRRTGRTWSGPRWPPRRSVCRD